MSALTKETPVRWRESTHYNGGKEFFAYDYVCVEYPRLVKHVRYVRKNRSTEVSWVVDGERVADLDAAIVALRSPPTLSEGEAALLARIPAEWTDLRQVEPHELLRSLRLKGLIEAERGRYRLPPDASGMTPTPALTKEMRR